MNYAQWRSEQKRDQRGSGGGHQRQHGPAFLNKTKCKIRGGRWRLYGGHGAAPALAKLLLGLRDLRVWRVTNSRQHTPRSPGISLLSASHIIALSQHPVASLFCVLSVSYLNKDVLRCSSHCFRLHTAFCRCDPGTQGHCEDARWQEPHSGGCKRRYYPGCCVDVEH